MSKTNAKTITLTVPGMGSDHCAGIVRQTLERLDGVDAIQTNIASHRVSVTAGQDGPDGDALRQAVEGAGYDVAAVSDGSGKQQVRLTVPGMGSDHCAGIIRSTLERLAGVESIDTNIASHRVSVTGELDGDALKRAVEGAGYDVAAVQTDEAEDGDSDAEIEEAYLGQARKRLIIAAIPTTLIMLLMMPHMFWQPIPGYLAIIAVLAFPVVFLFGGIATHKSTWRSLKNGTFNMDVLISMGSLPPT